MPYKPKSLGRAFLRPGLGARQPGGVSLSRALIRTPLPPEIQIQCLSTDEKIDQQITARPEQETATMRTKLGDYLFTRLKQLGINTVFGVPDGKHSCHSYRVATADLNAQTTSSPSST